MTMSSVRQGTSAMNQSFLSCRGNHSQLNFQVHAAEPKGQNLKPKKTRVHRQKPDVLSHENQELLKRLLITISKGERSIERQRQVLASLQRFEPHSAFQRIDRDQDGKLSSLELLKFLRDNGVEEATEADSHYIVRYFDSNADEMLEYEDLMQMVMPCDDQYLRAAIAQRDIYEVSKHDYLDTDIEIELTRLFEKEIALNRVTEELKQAIKATKSFCVNLAFQAIDDWKYGYIDKKNLKSFLRKHNYLATTAECMAIIRRLDLDADARLSLQEFSAGLQPEQPFNKAMKRTQMRTGTQSNGLRGNSRQSLGVKSGQILMLKNSQRDDLRTLAMDRHQSKKGLMRGTTPLKTRPSIAPNLSQFVSPPSSVRRVIHARIPSSSQLQTRQLPKSSLCAQQTPRSARSRKQSITAHRQPVNQSNATMNSSSMRRHASAIASGRRKKDQKPAKYLKNNEKKKSNVTNPVSATQDDFDDFALERQLHRANYKLRGGKKRADKDYKTELSRLSAKQLGMRRNTGRASFERHHERSLSRSSRKVNKENYNNDRSRLIAHKYRSFVKKLGHRDSSLNDRKQSADEASNRGFSSRRSASRYQDDGFDTRQLQSYDASNNLTSHYDESQPQSSLRKKRPRSKHNRNLSSGEDCPRQYLKARDQSREPSHTNRASCTDTELQQTMVPVTSEPLRRPVISNHRSDVASPKSILPREEENFFMHCLHEMMTFEKDLEVQKISLSRREDFNLIDAFGILDEDGKGNLNPNELHQALNQRLSVMATHEDCYLLFHRINREVDGLLKYSEFTSTFMPVDQHYARQLGSKRLQYCAPPSRASFSLETMRHFSDVWQLLIKIEQSVEKIKQSMASRPAFDFDQAFRSCDQSFSGQITFRDIKNLMLEYGLHVSREDIQLLIYRLDRDKDARINFLEFKQGLAPSRYYMYQNGQLNGDMSILLEQK